MAGRMNRVRPTRFEISFRKFIDAVAFPCVGAKSAMHRGGMRFLTGLDIESAGDDDCIARGLREIGTEQFSGLVSFVVGFPVSRALSEAAFEQALWARLSCVHAVDRDDFAWDPSVSADPASPRFSMSVGAVGFYVVGLHPGASRMARRFSCPVLVFNPRRQFDRLRRDGHFEMSRAAIMARDVALSGSVNPMLDAHGERSEARQYSGRAVGPDWRCPFQHGASA